MLEVHRALPAAQVEEWPQVAVEREGAYPRFLPDTTRVRKADRELGAEHQVGVDVVGVEVDLIGGGVASSLEHREALALEVGRRRHYYDDDDD